MPSCYEGWGLKIIELCKKKTQTEKGLMVSKIRSDHGGQFENELLEIFSDKNVIALEFSTPRTPQQNRIVEHKDRSLQTNS